MPTFAGSQEWIDICPIIAARSLCAFDMAPQKRLLNAGYIISQVCNGIISPWFSKPCITEGLTLWYLSPYLDPSDICVRKLVERLLEAEKDLAHEDNVCRACILLGLVASTRLLKTSGGIVYVIERQVDKIFATQEAGMWKGEPVGIFGFGRLYSDNLFASVLSLYALIEYSEY